MKKLLCYILLLSSLTLTAAKPKHTFVKIETDLGNCVIMLYNQTPKHRDNFIKLTKDKIYDGTLFHRVIKEFMIQGGDPDSKTAVSGQRLGEGDLGYLVDAEFRDSLFHKKGVLAAARGDNPAKASSASQFYLVQGKVWDDAGLDNLIQRRLNGRQIPASQRMVYKTQGGVPHLDQNYTVYGEVVEGIEMIDQIASVKTDTSDRPIIDVKMKVSILKKQVARKIEKRLNLKQNLL